MRARFRIQGRVQSVGFRYWAQDRAQRLSLSGWIRNDSDGAVSGVAEGSTESMGVFREILGLGPEQARIRLLDWELDKAEAAGGESLPFPFEIRP